MNLEFNKEIRQQQRNRVNRDSEMQNFDIPQNHSQPFFANSFIVLPAISYFIAI